MQQTAFASRSTMNVSSRTTRPLSEETGDSEMSGQCARTSVLFVCMGNISSSNKMKELRAIILGCLK